MSSGTLKSILIFILGWFDRPLERIIRNIILLAIFSTLYYFSLRIEDNGVERSLSVEEAIYYAFTVHFTLGFGGFNPSNRWGRVMYAIHVSLVWLINLVPLGVLRSIEYKDAGVPYEVSISHAGETRKMSDIDILNKTLANNLHKSKEIEYI